MVQVFALGCLPADASRVPPGGPVPPGPPPSAAPAPWNGRITWIDERVGALWDAPLRSSVAWVDRATGSRMRFGACRQDARCVILREGNPPGSALGWTTHRGLVSVITLDSRAGARRGPYTRRAIIDHELGHSFWLNHNPRCTSRMYHRIPCAGGKLPPRTWTAAERAVLRQY